MFAAQAFVVVKFTIKLGVCFSKNLIVSAFISINLDKIAFEILSRSSKISSQI